MLLNVYLAAIRPLGQSLMQAKLVLNMWRELLNNWGFSRIVKA